jgi:hypothetical protein
MKLSRILEIQWRVMQLFFGIMVLGSVVIGWSAVSMANSEGKPFPLEDILIIVSMLAAAFAMMWLSRRFFNFIAGDKACHWWFP